MELREPIRGIMKRGGYLLMAARVWLREGETRPLMEDQIRLNRPTLQDEMIQAANSLAMYVGTSAWAREEAGEYAIFFNGHGHENAVRFRGLAEKVRKRVLKENEGRQILLIS